MRLLLILLLICFPVDCYSRVVIAPSLSVFGEFGQFIYNNSNNKDSAKDRENNKVLLGILGGLVISQRLTKNVEWNLGLQLPIAFNDVVFSDPNIKEVNGRTFANVVKVTKGFEINSYLGLKCRVKPKLHITPMFLMGVTRYNLKNEFLMTKKGQPIVIIYDRIANNLWERSQHFGYAIAIEIDISKSVGVRLLLGYQKHTEIDFGEPVISDQAKRDRTVNNVIANPIVNSANRYFRPKTNFLGNFSIVLRTS